MGRDKFVERNLHSAALAMIEGATDLPGLEPEMLASILRLGVEERHDEGHLVSGRQGAERAIYVVIEGGVRVSISTLEGKEVVLFDRTHPGGLFGLGHIDAEFDDEITAEVLEPRTVFRVLPRSCLLSHVDAYPAGTAWFLTLASDLFVEERSRISELALHSVHSRVRRTLRHMAEVEPSHAIETTREEVARIAGTSREEVSRVISDLCRRHLVEVPSRGRIIVPDPEALIVEIPHH